VAFDVFADALVVTVERGERLADRLAVAGLIDRAVELRDAVGVAVLGVQLACLDAVDEEWLGRALAERDGGEVGVAGELRDRLRRRVAAPLACEQTRSLRVSRSRCSPTTSTSNGS
jgi:hypothetical protein